ncbi:hypothetical protein DE146DRAFT_294001 [Phaeosphaeria sp. MPI-PUGE-AT-0046c]|nr:hypothetical protein DE146DRAFT_294001 [Phaeosphaeria sp. MPI-PUGE-AT-0046c]
MRSRPARDLTGDLTLYPILFIAGTFTRPHAISLFVQSGDCGVGFSRLHVRARVSRTWFQLLTASVGLLITTVLTKANRRRVFSTHHLHVRADDQLVDTISMQQRRLGTLAYESCRENRDSCPVPTWESPALQSYHSRWKVSQASGTRLCTKGMCRGFSAIVWDQIVRFPRCFNANANSSNLGLRLVPQPGQVISRPCPCQ